MRLLKHHCYKLMNSKVPANLTINTIIQYVLGLLVSLAMAARFGHAYYKTSQVWPAGVVAVASCLMVARYLNSAATGAGEKKA